MRRAEIAFAAIVLAVLAVGIALIPLQSSAFTRALSLRYSEADALGITSGQAAAYAEQVRAHVVWGRGELPVGQGPAGGFDEEAVGHLADVRAVILFAQVLTTGLALGVAMWATVRLRRPGGSRVVGGALLLGGLLISGLAVAIALIGLIDFDAVFSAFHKLFFAEGTWTFPWDSLLIRLFPEPFWLVSAAVWGTFVVVVAAVYVASGALLRRRERGIGAHGA